MQPGMVIQGYRLTAHLGEGGMASVWRATHPADGRAVAIKVFEPRLARQAQFRQRFFAEGEHQSRLRHPNVVRVHQILLDPLALVMDLVEGGTLAAELRRGRLAPARVRTLAADLCAGVGAAHALGILHRDLKPHNVLLTREGRAQVTDFGLARLAGESLHTQTGQVMGTPRYMAPEQIRGLKHIDLRADVYALGVMLFELVTGEPPFTGTDYQLALAHTQTPAPDPATRAPGVPPALAAVILQALAKDPARRPAHATALGALVEAAFAEPGRVQPPPPARPSVPVHSPEALEPTAETPPPSGAGRDLATVESVLEPTTPLPGAGWDSETDLRTSVDIAPTESMALPATQPSMDRPALSAPLSYGPLLAAVGVGVAALVAWLLLR